MQRCPLCAQANLICRTLPTYQEDLGGVRVELIGAVTEAYCPHCQERLLEVPAMPLLLKTAALARLQLPVRLIGCEVRYMRKAVGMNGRAFADAIGMNPATLSRWEHDDATVGVYAEMLMRHVVGALLRDQATHFPYDPCHLVGMKLQPAVPDAPVIVRLEFMRIIGRQEHAWDAVAA